METTDRIVVIGLTSQSSVPLWQKRGILIMPWNELNENGVLCVVDLIKDDCIYRMRNWYGGRCQYRLTLYWGVFDMFLVLKLQNNRIKPLSAKCMCSWSLFVDTICMEEKNSMNMDYWLNEDDIMDHKFLWSLFIIFLRQSKKTDIIKWCYNNQDHHSSSDWTILSMYEVEKTWIYTRMEDEKPFFCYSASLL